MSGGFRGSGAQGARAAMCLDGLAERQNVRWEIQTSLHISRGSSHLVRVFCHFPPRPTAKTPPANYFFPPIPNEPTH